MSQIHRRLGAIGTVMALAVASPVWAWHITGQVFCDQNGNQTIDGTDTTMDGVGILITALTASPGSMFPATTGFGNGFFTVTLPHVDDDYRVELTGAGLPAGANTIVPSSGAYGEPPVAALHLETGDWDATADFLVDGCVATPSPSSTPTAVATDTPSPTATETPPPSATATPISTETETPLPSATATPIPTDTNTPVVTVTPTRTSTVTPLLTSTPTPARTPDASLTAFECYEVEDSTVGPIFGVDVVDRFGAATIDLAARRRVGRLCNPAIVSPESQEEPTDPDHLIGYVISGRTPQFSPVFGLTVTNQFGTVVVRAVRPVLLLVPSAKSLTAPPPPFTDPAIDHFQCYTVRGGRGRFSAVQVSDQFGTATIDLKRPIRLCTAVDKRGEGVLDPQSSLLCYSVRPTKDTVPFRGLPDPVHVANQFGSDTLVVHHARELCVPSLVTPAP